MKTIKVEICQGNSCHLLGSQELVEALEKLPAGWREQVELLRVDCLKTCRQGPNVRINQELFPGITPEVLIGLLKDKLRLLEA